MHEDIEPYKWDQCDYNTNSNYSNDSHKTNDQLEEEEEYQLTDLTAEMQQVIGRAVRSKGEVLIDSHRIQMTSKDIATLTGLRWLNDQVINFYLQMIIQRAGKGEYQSAYAFSTFFFPKMLEGGHSCVQRWTSQVDIFRYSLILVPIHLGIHWCLATIDTNKKTITYYDSMGGSNQACLQALTQYLSEEHQARKGTSMDLSNWSQVTAKKIPQQMNGSDCGVFTCKYAEFLARKAKLSFKQQHMPYFRQRMIYEIITNSLISP